VVRILPFLIVLLVVALLTKADFFFYLLYTLAGVLFLGRLWARRSLRSVTLARHHDSRLFLGETLDVEVEIRNRSWLPVLWLRLSDTLPTELALSQDFRHVISLLPRERLRLGYALRGRRRGYYEIGPLLTLGGDLLGATTFEGRQVADDFVIVYPKIVHLRDLGFPSQSPFGTLSSRERVFEDPSRVQGVRDYVPGDSLRRMDWKTSARVGSLQVRRFEPAISLETAIFLNLDGSEYARRDRLRATELCIVIAASVAVHVAEKRQAVGLVTNGCDPLQDSAFPAEHDPASAEEGNEGAEVDCTQPTPALPLRKGREHLMRLLDLLARIELASEEGTVPFLELLSRRSLELPWGSTVVAVTGREVEGLMSALLALRRRGLVVILVLTCPDRDLKLTRQRAEQIGVQALGIWSEQDLELWR
jgi:uncharacterized protein (DUF58 family)